MDKRKNTTHGEFFGVFEQFCSLSIARFTSQLLGQSPEEKTVDGKPLLCDKDTAHEIRKEKDMKTNTLLVAGLLMAASAAPSFAQTVYSVNAVGFVNVTIPPGFSIVCNPLEGAANTAPALFPSVPLGTTLYKFSGGAFLLNTFGFSGWGSTTETYVPGEGFFIKNPTATPYINTFVGNVKQGTLTTPVSSGFTLVGSQVPQSGLVVTDLQAPVAQFETIYKYDGTQYLPYVLGFSGWNPSEPTVNVGEGFFLKKNNPGTWTRTFSVNQ